MHWDWSVNIGNVLTAIGLLVAFVTAHIQNVKSIEEIKGKVNVVYRWFERHVINGATEE